MKNIFSKNNGLAPWLLTVAVLLVAAFPAVWAEEKEPPPAPKPAAEADAAAGAAVPAQTDVTKVNATSKGPKVDIYGFAMLDMGHDFGQVDPAWFDVVRPTKLPAFEDQFCCDGNFYSGVRQSRFGIKGFVPTSMGELKTTFEFELFGTGVDAGQTTFRLRHAYGEIGPIGAGQTWSPFMDPDVFPNSVEYWGPTGMVFFRNVQFRYMPIRGDTTVILALERPGASGDQGVYANRIELQGIRPSFPIPDFSYQVRRKGDWGHVQFSGIVRRIEWDDTLADQFDLADKVTGWGFNLSTNLKIAKDTIRASVVYGEGIQNYMNDAPVDIGIENNFSDPVRPILGRPLPLLGVVAFYDRTWSDRFTSSIGYSMIDIDNSSGQAADAFRQGHYGLANLMFYPVPGAMLGPEVQWGRRENFRDGWTYDDFRVQFSAKYNFSTSIE